MFVLELMVHTLDPSKRHKSYRVIRNPLANYNLSVKPNVDGKKRQPASFSGECISAHNLFKILHAKSWNNLKNMR